MEFSETTETTRLSRKTNDIERLKVRVNLTRLVNHSYLDNINKTTVTTAIKEACLFPTGFMGLACIIVFYSKFQGDEKS